MQCAEHISLAIANVRLRDELRNQSIRDLLTGLYNRRYFLENLRTAIDRAEKTKGSLSVISFDADRFKNFNDNHGHDAGDMVLRAISEAVQTELNADELGARYGGEEFAILLPGAKREDALATAEKLRKAIENIKIQYGGGELPNVSISAGVATFPEHGRSPQVLLKSADQALYEAKKQGRNRVCEFR